jgi:anti-sigma regulatory factor (Ser/Thr protein kinase)
VRPQADRLRGWADRRRPLAAGSSPHERWSIPLEPTTLAPARAREAVEPLRGVVSDRRLEDVRLMVSELVTNAVLHGGQAVGARPIQLEVGVLPGTVIVSVADGGPGFDPRRLEPSSELSPGRRGLELVAALADEVGIDGRNPFRVWFRVSRAGARAR